jgi:hypothetical protein
MDSQTTFWLMVAGLVVTIAASLGDIARRRSPLAWHAYLPWHALIFAGGTAVLLASVHLVSLARVTG